MSDPETECPECSGSGFYGGNGTIVQSSCSFCGGTGVLVEGSAYRHLEKRPMGREEMAVWNQMFWNIQERRDREGFG